MLAIDRHHLPDDIPTLKAMIMQLLDVVEKQQQVIATQALKIAEQQQIIMAQALQIEQQQRIIAAQSLKIEEQAARITALEQEVSELKRHRFGRRSERVTTRVMSLDSLTPSTPKDTASKGRQALPEHLTRETVFHELDAEQRVCLTCGERMQSIGVLTSEQLDLIPAKVIVLRHQRHKYACRVCQDRILIAHKPAQPLEKGLPTAALLAEVLVSKYADHCPLYRQQQRWARVGVTFSRATLSRWVSHCGMLLQPLVKRMTQQLLQGDHLFTDDTTLPVLASHRCQQGRLWVYTTKDRPGWPRCVVYDYTPTRQGRGPQQFLAAFAGYLQADAYAGYDLLYLDPNRIEVGCWAHARRKFYDVMLKQQQPGLAQQAVIQIQALYDIERQATEQQLTDEARQQYRVAKATVYLEQFKHWLDTHITQVLPRSALGQAMQYVLNHWTALTTYLQRGDLEIDNNRAERGMRSIALGRKNYLFAGNHQAGQAAAIIYSLIETCRLHQVNPQVYLEAVLRLVSTHPNARIDELMPWNFHQLAPTQQAA